MATIDMAKHHCTAENAPKFKDWFANRGGILVWSSVDLSDPRASMTGPYRDPDGNVNTEPPHWKLGRNPRHITDPAEVEVCVDKEVRRFRIATRMGSQGFMIKLTDHSSQKVRDAVAKAGTGAHYVFDYETQEAVIMAPDKVVPLTEWVEPTPTS